ncbi:hypothetical protein KY311_02020 [Candidatus Woesearchaeota archaeon]|nr:hypothetical protein [Candidatus Woesearchaeota archaeon]
MHHRIWLSSLLNVPVSYNGGIDLADNDVGIELKCRYEIYNHSFAVHEYQIEQFQKENPGKHLFWAFLIYGLKMSPKRIGNHNIGRLIQKREVWFIDWDWVRQFPVSYPKTGPYVYVKEENFPDRKTMKRFSKKGGTLYLPDNCVLEERLK